MSAALTTSESATTGAFVDLERRVAAEVDPTRRTHILVSGLADAIKTTSNDQNVQRLSRELRAAADGLVKATVGH